MSLIWAPLSVAAIAFVALVVLLVKERARRPSQSSASAASASTPTSFHFPGDGSFSQMLVLNDEDQAVLNQICGGWNEEGHQVERLAHLHRDPHFPGDSDAVMVIIDNLKVGYLAPQDAKVWLGSVRRRLVTHLSHTCNARITGGWRRPKRNGAMREGPYEVGLDLLDEGDRHAPSPVAMAG
jgi:hypothetical protein